MSERTVTTVPTLLGYTRIVVYLLSSLLALALVVVGTIAVIAELKGTWHWSIHLESTVSYVGLFVGWLLIALVPLTAVLVAGRALYE